MSPFLSYNFLEKRILGDDKLFGCDIFRPDDGATTNEVWNYPVYSLVKADYREKSEQTDEKVVEITCEVKYWKSDAGKCKGRRKSVARGGRKTERSVLTLSSRGGVV